MPSLVKGSFKKFMIFLFFSVNHFVSLDLLMVSCYMLLVTMEQTPPESSISEIVLFLILSLIFCGLTSW